MPAIERSLVSQAGARPVSQPRVPDDTAAGGARTILLKLSAVLLVFDRRLEFKRRWKARPSSEKGPAPADPPHSGSMSRPVFMVVHSYFDLDARLCDREFAGQRCDQFRRRLERIDDFLAPRVVFRLLLVGEPDLHHIAVL